MRQAVWVAVTVLSLVPAEKQRHVLAFKHPAVDGPGAPVEQVDPGQRHPDFHCPMHAGKPTPELLERCSGISAGIWACELLLKVILLIKATRPEKFEEVEQDIKSHKFCWPFSRCPRGTARAKAPTNNTVLETPSSCPSCVNASVYSDDSGLLECKQCPAGHFGVIKSGSKADGGHKACDDDTCELPTELPANSMLVLSQCPDHGKHASKNGADTCLLSCKPGFYSSSTQAPFKCAPDGKSTKASYQGGAITCTGLHVTRCWMCFGDRGAGR